VDEMTKTLKKEEKKHVKMRKLVDSKEKQFEEMKALQERLLNTINDFRVNENTQKQSVSLYEKERDRL